MGRHAKQSKEVKTKFFCKYTCDNGGECHKIEEGYSAYFMVRFVKNTSLPFLLVLLSIQLPWSS